MSLDRFVTWKKKAPPKEHIKEALEDFLRGFSTSVEWLDGSRILAELLGEGSSMWKRRVEGFRVYHQKERWIEVFVDPKYMDVITRMQDDVTNALAKEFALRCAMFWKGEFSV